MTSYPQYIINPINRHDIVAVTTALLNQVFFAGCSLLTTDTTAVIGITENMSHAEYFDREMNTTDREAIANQKPPQRRNEQALIVFQHSPAIIRCITIRHSLLLPHIH